MPEKHDLLAAILAAKEQRTQAILAFAIWRTFAANIMAVRLQKQLIDATMRQYRHKFIRDLPRRRTKVAISLI